MLRRVVLHRTVSPPASATVRPASRLRPTRADRVHKHVLAVFLLVAMVAGVAGCGRKATREDCEAVVDKNVELQLKALGVTDPAVVGKRREEMRASMREDIDKCVGKRVTDAMMSCVRGAETAEKIDKCLR